MPTLLLHRIISQYSQNNADAFKSNNAMLKLVLENGNNEQKEIVVQTLIDRINKNSDIEGVRDIINTYDKWRKKDKAVLSSMLQRHASDG